MIASSQSRTIEIVGGGLAGLGLALGLRQHDVPVVLHEAGTYPRHRVCGEFITSLDAATIEHLALGSHLADARLATGVTWYRAGRACHTHALPTPALCLSRHQLDERLARAALAAGVDLRVGQRVSLPPADGIVFSHGRQPAKASRWMGLKQHVQDLRLDNDLELHLGHRSYVGLTRIEDDRVNVCGLFDRNSANERPTTTKSLAPFLRQAGLAALADRIAAAKPDPASFCAVAGLSYRPPDEDDPSLSLGDHFGLIPPFTGNGMTVAWQSAALALPHLVAWSHGQSSWTDTRTRIRADLTHELSPKFNRARRLHPFLLHPFAQTVLVSAARCRLLPTTRLYYLLH